MIYVAPLMQVVVYVGFWWLTQTAKRHTLGEVKVSKTILWIQTVGIFFYVITMASLDTGTGIDTIHDVSATIFFVLMIIGFEMSTCTLKKLRAISPRTISASSLYFKQWVSWGLVATALYGLMALLLKDQVPPEQKELIKAIANSAEWVGVTLICLYLGSYSWDWPGLEIVLSLPGIT